MLATEIVDRGMDRRTLTHACMCIISHIQSSSTCIAFSRYLAGVQWLIG
jgi:hypothetical protein